MNVQEFQGPRLYRRPIELEIRAIPEPPSGLSLNRAWSDIHGIYKDNLSAEIWFAWDQLQKWAQYNEAYRPSDWDRICAHVERVPEIARLAALARAFDGNTWDH